MTLYHNLPGNWVKPARESPPIHDKGGTEVLYFRTGTSTDSACYYTLKQFKAWRQYMLVSSAHTIRCVRLSVPHRAQRRHERPRLCAHQEELAVLLPCAQASTHRQRTGQNCCERQLSSRTLLSFWWVFEESERPLLESLRQQRTADVWSRQSEPSLSRRERLHKLTGNSMAPPNTTRNIIRF